jgi:hypothetical protein
MHGLMCLAFCLGALLAAFDLRRSEAPTAERPARSATRVVTLRTIADRRGRIGY